MYRAASEGGDGECWPQLVRRPDSRRMPGCLSETALIGFAGAPWTVATYMVEGGTSRDFHRVKTWAYRDAEGFAALIEKITAATLDFLALADRSGRGGRPQLFVLLGWCVISRRF